jgi:hypothetical protein
MHRGDGKRRVHAGGRSGGRREKMGDELVWWWRGGCMREWEGRGGVAEGVVVRGWWWHLGGGRVANHHQN